MPNIATPIFGSSHCLTAHRYSPLAGRSVTFLLHDAIAVYLTALVTEYNPQHRIRSSNTNEET